MKKILLLALALGSWIASFPAVHVVMVSNFQFSPRRVNAVVGDVIRWVWVNGNHTTTSDAIPNGAAPWNARINTSNRVFRYTVRRTGTYRYHCTPHQSIGMTGVIRVTNSLTTDLTDMTVDISPDEKAIINWKTTDDKDIAYYSVQRSNDGVDFTEIAKVKPHEISNARGAYSYIDNTLVNDKYLYYQLEMIDKSGNNRISSIKLFTQPTKTTKLITNLTPNPVPKQGHLMFRFNADKDGKMLVQLYDVNGNFISQTEMTAVKGLNNGHFHLGDLSPGSYFIVCTLGTTKEKYSILIK